MRKDASIYQGQFRQAQRVIRFVEQHVGSPFTIRDISEAVGVSYFYLQHQFAETSRETLWQMVKRMRLEHAFGYLKHSDLSMTDISDLTGYSGKYSLSKAFSGHFNHSPSYIRQKTDIVAPNSFGSYTMNERVIEAFRNLSPDNFKISYHPKRQYFYKYYDPMPILKTDYQRLSASANPDGYLQGQKTRSELYESGVCAISATDFLEVQDMLRCPLSFVSSYVSCATEVGTNLIKGGFLLEADDTRHQMLRLFGYDREQVEAGRVLSANLAYPVSMAGILSYLVLRMLSREFKMSIRNHDVFVTADLSGDNGFEISVPVI